MLFLAASMLILIFLSIAFGHQEAPDVIQLLNSDWKVPIWPRNGTVLCSSESGVTCGADGGLIGLILVEMDLGNPSPTIPSSLCSKTLETLVLSGLNLVGNVPSCLQAEFFDLSNNQLTGPLPALALSSSVVNLRNNFFTGALPPAPYPNAPQWVDLSCNDLTSDQPIDSRWFQAPVEFTSTIDFSFNPGLRVELPASITTNYLAQLYLHWTNQTGSLPDDICHLEEFSFSYNPLVECSKRVPKCCKQLGSGAACGRQCGAPGWKQTQTVVNRASQAERKHQPDLSRGPNPFIKRLRAVSNAGGGVPSEMLPLPVQLWSDDSTGLMRMAAAYITLGTTILVVWERPSANADFHVILNATVTEEAPDNKHQLCPEAMDGGGNFIFDPSGRYLLLASCGVLGMTATASVDLDASRHSSSVVFGPAMPSRLGVGNGILYPGGFVGGLLLLVIPEPSGAAIMPYKTTALGADLYNISTGNLVAHWPLTSTRHQAGSSSWSWGSEVAVNGDTTRHEFAIGSQANGPGDNRFQPVLVYEVLHRTAADRPRVLRQQMMFAPATAGTCFFGLSLAMFGDYLLVGDPALPPLCTGPGKVHVYRRLRRHQPWTLVQSLQGRYPSCVVGSDISFNGRILTMGCHFPEQNGGPHSALVAILDPSSGLFTQKPEYTVPMADCKPNGVLKTGPMASVGNTVAIACFNVTQIIEFK